MKLKDYLSEPLELGEPDDISESNHFIVIAKLRAENERLREALKELAYSPVAFTDDRISYVEMQVDKDVLETAKKALEVGGK